MFDHKYQTIRVSMKSFYTLPIVLASSMLLVSCGGESSQSADQAITSSESSSGVSGTGEEARMKVLAVPPGWFGRPPINTSGPIPYNPNKLDDESKSRPANLINGYIKNQFWIGSKAGTTSQQIISNIKGYSALRVIAVRTGSVLVEVANEEDSRTIAQLSTLNSQSWVSEIYNRIVTGVDVGSGVLYTDTGDGPIVGNSNWHLAAIRAQEAWALLENNTSMPHIGVADYGLSAAHEDLRDQTIESLDRFDGHSHGTAVISTIAATRGNGIGTAGVASNSKISYVTINPTEILETIETVHRLVAEKPDIRIINASWGFSSVTDLGRLPAFRDGILKTRPLRVLVDQYPNILFVFSAGNDGVEAYRQNGAMHLDRHSNPSPKPNVVIVGASVMDDKMAGYSSYGLGVDIVAPTEFKAAKGRSEAGSTYFVVPQGYSYGTTYAGVFSGGPCDPCAFNGTSAAAPIVSAVAGLMLSANGNLSPVEIKNALITSSSKTITSRYRCEPLGSRNCGFTENLPNGIGTPFVDAERAVKRAIELKNQVPVTKDANIANPAGTWTGSEYLTVCGASWGITAKALLQFDVSGVPKTISNAYLNLYAVTGDSGYQSTVDVYRNLASWDEATINWTNRPAIETPRSSSIAVPAGQYATWYRIPITDLVRSWKTTPANNYGVTLDSAVVGNSGCRSFASMEASNATTRPYISWD